MKIKVQSPAVARYAERHGVDLSTVKGTGAEGRITLEDVRAAVPAPYVTPMVARTAAEHGVDLREVQGTGIGGRIRRDDVLRAAGKAPAGAVHAPAHVAAFAAEHQVDLSTIAASDAAEGVSLIDVSDAARARGDMELWAQALGEQFKVNREGLAASSPSRTSASTVISAYARNPLVDQVRAIRAQAGRPVASAPAPSLFASGDTPAFTASGIPPEAVLQVPWQARHAVASAATPAEAYGILSECANDEGYASQYARHDGNAEYQHRVQQWHMASLSDDELRQSIEPGASEEVSRRQRAQVEAYNRTLQPFAGNDTWEANLDRVEAENAARQEAIVQAREQRSAT